MTSLNLHTNVSTSAYAVLRVDRRKAKTMAAIAAAVGHQLRTKATPNADPDGPAPLQMFLAKGKTPYQAVQHLLDGAERRNRETVLCREIVISASPVYFRPGLEQVGGTYDPERLRAWANATLTWAKQTWPDQLASMVLHLDEQTPHAHLLVVPRMSKASGGWRLNSKAFFDRERLRELQTSYGEAVSHLGIKRGEPGSKAMHTEVRKFYGATQKAQAQPQRVSIPPAPKPPTRPTGLMVCADVLSKVFGFETDYQRAVRTHSVAMNTWRELVNRLRQEDSDAWECMRAQAAIATIKQRSQRQTTTQFVPTPSAQLEPTQTRSHAPRSRGA